MRLSLLFSALALALPLHATDAHAGNEWLKCHFSADQGEALKTQLLSIEKTDSGNYKVRVHYEYQWHDGPADTEDMQFMFETCERDATKPLVNCINLGDEIVGQPRQLITEIVRRESLIDGKVEVQEQLDPKLFYAPEGPSSAMRIVDLWSFHPSQCK